jgi:hypothetical protein
MSGMGLGVWRKPLCAKELEQQVILYT